MGNGAKAQQKRERNAKDAGGAAKSQLKSVRIFVICGKETDTVTREPLC